MLTSLRETTPASEYAHPPSKSFVFKDSSIHEGGYFVSRILTADRDSDTLSNGGGRDRLFAN